MLFGVGCKVRTVQQAAGEKILLFDLPIGKSPTSLTYSTTSSFRDLRRAENVFNSIFLPG